ncbi:ATP-binding protein [Sphaerisporangium sp. NPDC005288]|uniref:ATP-binding protein n=1 Tax=Sphaerisporangium sp. NPDC005288 TaxID=3155114 RepID=UPI0033A54FD1
MSMAPDTLKELYLPSTPESASQARSAVRNWLGTEHPAYEPVRLAVSELVTNAVRHATAAYQSGQDTQDGQNDHDDHARALVLRLLADGHRLRVEVTDRGPSTTRPRVRVEQALLLAERVQVEPSFLLGEGGRGLAIVDMLSAGNWGFRSNPDGPGCTVWCEITTEPADLDPEHPRRESVRTV